MAKEGPVHPITVDQGSMKRSSRSDEEMGGSDDLKPTQTKAPKCQARPDTKVVKMNYAGPLRHHRVRNHRYLDYLVGSVSYYPSAMRMTYYFLLTKLRNGCRPTPFSGHHGMRRLRHTGMSQRGKNSVP